MNYIYKERESIYFNAERFNFRIEFSVKETADVYKNRAENDK